MFTRTTARIAGTLTIVLVTGLAFMASLLFLHPEPNLLAAFLDTFDGPIPGDSSKDWMGCIPDQYSHSVYEPGYAATRLCHSDRAWYYSNQENGTIYYTTIDVKSYKIRYGDVVLAYGSPTYEIIRLPHFAYSEWKLRENLYMRAFSFERSTRRHFFHITGISFARRSFHG